MDVALNFGENISALIFDRGMNVERFSKEVNIDSSVIYKYQRRQSLPSLTNFIVIADYFGCSADGLLGNLSDYPTGGFKPAKNFSERLNQLLEEKGIKRYGLRKKAKEKGYSFAKQSLDDWVHGTRIPSVINAVALAECLDVSLDYLLGRE
jgi:transcriptional regulator with XRE-family HTH domain